MDTKRFQVAITETYRRIVTVEASNAREAYNRAHDAYQNTEIVLGKDTYEGTEFYVLDNNCTTEPKYTIERKG